MKTQQKQAINGEDVLRHVDIEGYRLKTWDTHHRHHNGPQWAIGYAFCDPQGNVLFTGEDFGCSPLHTIDSDECLRSLLGFLTLRPGDTDSDYFAGYTQAQMAFAQGDAENLSLYAMEPEDGYEVPAFNDVEVQA